MLIKSKRTYYVFPNMSVSEKWRKALKAIEKVKTAMCDSFNAAKDKSNIQN